MTDTLERAISRFRPVSRDGEEPVQARVTAAAFRAAVEQRLAGVERDIGEIKSRVNGLIFVVIGAVITQLVLRVAA